MKHPSQLSDAATLLLQLGGPTLSGVIRWLMEVCHKHESIEVYEWTDGWWYIEVQDKRIEGAIQRMVMGLSVNVKQDEIMWANHTKYNAAGGNCYCRNMRWMRLLRKRFPKLTVTRQHSRHSQPADGMVYDYRPLKPAKPSAVLA